MAPLVLFDDDILTTAVDLRGFLLINFGHEYHVKNIF